MSALVNWRLRWHQEESTSTQQAGCALRRFAPSSRAGRIPPPFAQRPPPWQGSGPGQGAQGTTCCGPKRRGSVAGDPSALSHPPTHHFPSALLRDVPRFIRRTKARTVACTNDSAQSSPLRSRHMRVQRLHSARAVGCSGCATVRARRRQLVTRHVPLNVQTWAHIVRVQGSHNAHASQQRASSAARPTLSPAFCRCSSACQVYADPAVLAPSSGCASIHTHRRKQRRTQTRGREDPGTCGCEERQCLDSHARSAAQSRWRAGHRIACIMMLM